MPEEITLKSIALEKLNRIVNPNFENWVIRILLLTGLISFGYQRIIQLASTFEVLSGEMYLKISLDSGNDTTASVVGLFLVLCSLALFVRKKTKTKTLKRYKTLAKAARDIRPILDDNRRVFTAFGPNSGSGNTDELKLDHNIWEELKKKQIAPNNAEILSNLNRVRRFTSDEEPIIDKMICHIEAFQAHCNKPGIDYSKNQFPLEFADLIFGYCQKNDNNICNYGDWLKKELSESLDAIESIHIFGSALYGEETKDVDVVIKNNYVDINDIKNFSKISQTLKQNFYKHFSLNLHLMVFSQLENENFTSFIEKIYNSDKVI